MYRTCLTRQINEVESLKAVYYRDEEMTLWSNDEYQTLKRTLNTTGLTLDELPQVAFQMQLPLEQPYPESIPLVLRVKMPPFYPASGSVMVHANLDLLSPAQEKSMREAAFKFIESKLGQECVLDTIQFLKEWIYCHVTAPKKPATSQSGKPVQNIDSHPVEKAGDATSSKSAKSKNRPKPPVPAPKEQDFRRVMIWFSTIAPDRAKTVAEWARQLALTGVSRLGSPALITVEGQKEDVDEYISSLRSYRWKKMEIVWEDKNRSTNINSCRRFTNFQECILTIPELQQIYKKAGLEEMFKEGLKIR